MAEIEKNTTQNGNTPYCNTGYLDTRKTSIELPENGLRALIDWCSVTIKNINTFEDSLAILNLPFDKFEIRERGFNGYLYSAVYGEIMVCWGTPVGALEMGVHINLSGSACRQYESEFDLNMNWSDFFGLILNFDYKFTRLDIAIDDFKGYFTIRQLYNKGKKGHMTVKKVKKARYFEEFEIDTGFTTGETLYIGKCNQIFRFYDKYGERKSKGMDVYDNIDVWNRYEIQLRDAIATDAAKIIAYNVYSLGDFAKGIFKDKIDFKIPNKNDSNKSRWESCKWWTNFLGAVETIQLTQVAIDPTVPRIKFWIDKQVDKSLAVLNEAFDNDSMLLSYVISKGKEKMGKKDYQIIDDFKKEPQLKEQYLKEMHEYMYGQISQINSSESHNKIFINHDQKNYYVEKIIKDVGLELLNEKSPVRDIMDVVQPLSKYYAANVDSLVKKQISLGLIMRTISRYYGLSPEQQSKMQTKVYDNVYNYFNDYISIEFNLVLMDKKNNGFSYKEKKELLEPMGAFEKSVKNIITKTVSDN